MAQKTTTRKPRQGRVTRIEFKPKGKKGEEITFKVIGLNENMLDPSRIPGDRVIDRSEQAYFKALHKMVDEIFKESVNLSWTWGRLADEAGVAYQTVDNLGSRKTQRPQWRTVYRLANAVGFDMVMKQQPKSRRKPNVKVA